MVYKLVEANLREDNFSFKLKFTRDGQIVDRFFEYNPCPQSMCNEFSQLIGLQSSDSPESMLRRFQDCVGSQFSIPLDGVLFNPYVGFKNWNCTKFHSKVLTPSNLSTANVTPQVVKVSF